MNDEKLRDMFAELRRAESARVPALWGAAALGGRRGGSRRSTLQFALVVLVLFAVVVLTIPRRAPAPSITSWRAPTDFLLQTPGRELFTNVPDLKGTRQ